MDTESWDVLSDALHAAQLRSRVVDEASFTAPWGFRAESGPARFYCVLRGECRLEVEGIEGATMLGPGDLVVTAQQRAHCLRDAPDSPTVADEKLFGPDKKQPGLGVAIGGGGALTRLVCGCFLCDNRGFGGLLASLPPLVHLKGADGKPAPWLAETLRLMMRESDLNLPGRRAVVDRLAQIILIQAIRSCVSAMPDHRGNWLTALMDPHIGPVLGLMHTQPELPWTVASLAKRVCLSRSAFAARFKALVCRPPLQYLLECRMQKACALLTEGRAGIKEIAPRVGYTTEAAFSNAFKRWCGKSPGVFRRQARNPADRETTGTATRPCSGSPEAA